MKRSSLLKTTQIPFTRFVFLLLSILEPSKSFALTSLTINQTFDIGKYNISTGKDGESVITMNDFGLTSSPGDPQLPLKIYDLAV